MRQSRHLALALVVAAGLSTQVSAGEAKRIADFEARFLDRMAEKAQLPDATREAMEKILDKYDGQRRQSLQTLANSLKDLVRVNQSGTEAELEPLLESLETTRSQLHGMRLAKREEMESFFTDTQKLRFLGKMHQRFSKHETRGEGRGGKIKTLLRKHIPTLLTRVLGVEQSTVDTLRATFESREPTRKEMRTSMKALGEKIANYLESGEISEEASRLLVIQAKELHEKGHQAREDALTEIRTKLSVKQRADLVSKVFQGLQKLGGFASYFVDIEELKFFL